MLNISACTEDRDIQTPTVGKKNNQGENLRASEMLTLTPIKLINKDFDTKVKNLSSQSK